MKMLLIKILPLFIFWRVWIFVIAFLGESILPIFGNRFPYVDLLKESSLPHWIWSFGNFDGVHYLRIAQDGYAYQYTQVFFPLYPIMIRLFSDIFSLPFLISALLIANLAFLLTLYFFYKLLLLDFEPKVARWALIFLLSFPTSFFFGAVYTESLFLLLVITSFYTARKGDFFLSGLLGGFASATRLFGLLLFPVLLYEFYIQNKDKIAIRHLLFAIRQATPLLLVFGGFSAYVWYLWQRFGNPLYFWTAQEVFGVERTFGFVFPLQVFYRYFKILTSINPLSLAFFNASLEFLAIIFVLGLLFLGIKKVRPSYLIFSFLAVFLPTFSGTFSSMPRYVLIAFPLFIVLSQIKSAFLKIILISIFLILGFFSLILFSRGYWLA